MVPTIGKSTKSKLRSKISIFFRNVLIFGTLLHFFRMKPFFRFWGIFGDFCPFMGKKWGSVLSANEPSPGPGVKP